MGECPILAATTLRITNRLRASPVLLLASNRQAQVDLTSQVPKMSRAMEREIMVDMVMAHTNQNTKR